ncbi:ATP-binding protein [Paraburkholderia sp. CNPSo 3274]|uniref:ATP-binding protein n=1 Tax=unclassified Paraburkholderia TaxID=2615204 RepID=UPI0020B7C631|nr:MULTISPECIES: ATP-binding protein [unclassified Paraburkholderia]MCP3712474.1 ATP-binding protein [Paraburkholderia sp. CNPSo 3274]MCP3718471.1 ATP-binding protein [Paraburkholderia sp. CNPSo 3281]MCX5545482.1 ATP-binding protein [Paraburkholderia sp. CNPSo 3076]
MQVNASQLNALLTAYVPKRLPVLITGRPGIGKSDIVAQVADQVDHDLMISHPVVEDPTDSKGLPFAAADGQSARFLPFGDLERALQPRKRPLIWFLDDLGQASPAVQAAKMQLLLARRIGEHKLPENVTFLAATNRRNDNAGVSGILDPLISRFATVVELEATIEEWSAWAVANDIAPELFAFLRFRPDLLSVQKTSRDIEATPSPRSWGFVAKTMGVVPKELELISHAGSVGEGPATELLAFIQIYRQLPSPAAVLATPDVAPIPEAPSALYAISAALAMYANESNFERVVIYTERLIAAGLGEFAALLVTDALRKTPDLANTHAFIKAQGGPIGKLIHG